MTQEELAVKSEVSRNTISNIETDVNTNITYKVMEKIANALNEKVAVIFFNNLAQNIVQNENGDTVKERK